MRKLLMLFCVLFVYNLTAQQTQVDTRKLLVRQTAENLGMTTLRGYVYAYDSVYFQPNTANIPFLPTASPVGWVLTTKKGTTAQLVRTTLPQLYDAMMDTVSKAPTSYTTWVRDTTTGTLSPGTATDNIDVDNSSASGGNIFKGGVRFIHNFQATGTSGYNTFLGKLAGNLTLTGSSSGNQGSMLTGIGYEALENVTTGYQNTAVGYRPMHNATTGYQNTAVGYNALSAITGAYGNTAIGVAAMSNVNTDSAVTNVAVGNNTLTKVRRSCNVAVGNSALMIFEVGEDNIGIGTGPGLNIRRGHQNIFLGTYAAMDKDTGWFNIAIGVYSLKENLYGNHNTVIGTGSGYKNTGSNNVFLGYRTGYNNTGSGNVFLGYMAGEDAAGSNKLYIDNSDTETPLIYGDFANDTIKINGNLYVTKNISMPVSASGIGYLNIGAYSAARVVGTANFFYGNAGNLTLSGTYNFAGGYNSLSSLTTGGTNTGIGANALVSTTTGSDNVGIGKSALNANVANSGNTAIGTEAMQYANSTSSGSGTRNVAVGMQSLRGSTTAANNTGSFNTSVGAYALWSSTSGTYLTALGESAGYSNTSGGNNTYIGTRAGYTNTTGASNIMVGFRSGYKETGSHRSYWAADSTSWANGMGSGSKLLWYADMSNAAKSNHFMNIFAKLSIGAAKDPTVMLEVTGNATITGSLKSGTGTIADNDATPDVSGANTFIYAGSANSVTVTDLDNPVVGAYYTFIGNSDTYTVAFGGANFKMTGSSPSLGQYDTITFYCQADNLYIEISRTVYVP